MEPSKYPEPETLFIKEKTFVQRELNRRLKRTLKAKQKAEERLIESQSWPAKQHEAELLQSNMYCWKKGMRELHVKDWENDTDLIIKVDPQLEPQAELKERFRRVRKLRTGVPYAEKYLSKVVEEIESVSRWLEEAETLASIEELENFKKKAQITPKISPAIKEKTVEKRALPYREYLTDTGLKIWVGKGAAHNEKLTFSYANGSDWWFHVSEVPGSHVVLRMPKGHEPDPESIKDALQLALHYSKVKDRGEADICMTQCKHVSRFGKGKVGKVQISNYKTIYTKFDRERFQRLTKGL